MNQKITFLNKYMTNKNQTRKIRIRISKLNKNILKPIIGKSYVAGWNPEIFGDDSVEYNFKLPLGAIRRLICSYYENIYSVIQGWVDFKLSGSYEIRIKAYAYNMLDYLAEQLNKNRLNGQKIINEVYNQSFKEKFEQLDNKKKINKK